MNRRRFLTVAALAGLGLFLGRGRLFRPAGLRRFPGWNPPVPTPAQLAWQDMELGLFVHFGLPTYTGRVGALGDPRQVNPARLDADQWLSAATAIGARYAVLVAKHSDGFMAWPTDLYPFGLRQSPWREGKGDIVGDFVAACHRADVKPGLYVSTCVNTYWGACEPGRVAGGGDAQRAYNLVCERMVEELCTRYGELVELWFDGDVLPPEQGGPDIGPIIDRHQPHAMSLLGPRASIRLAGGETGTVPYPCWSTVRRRNQVGSGHPDGRYWVPAECDSPLRHGEWFWSPGQEDRLHTPEELMRMYRESVGCNANLLLNANPDRDGLIPEVDMRLYEHFGRMRRAAFGAPAGETSGEGNRMELRFPRPTRIAHVEIMEDIRLGERVRGYTLEGWVGGDRWIELGAGTAVGHKRIHRLEPAAELAGVRWRCLQGVRHPVLRRLAAYAA